MAEDGESRKKKWTLHRLSTVSRRSGSFTEDLPPDSRTNSGYKLPGGEVIENRFPCRLALDPNTKGAEKIPVVLEFSAEGINLWAKGELYKEFEYDRISKIGSKPDLKKFEFYYSPEDGEGEVPIVLKLEDSSSAKAMHTTAGKILAAHKLVHLDLSNAPVVEGDGADSDSALSTSPAPPSDLQRSDSVVDSDSGSRRGGSRRGEVVSPTSRTAAVKERKQITPEELQERVKTDADRLLEAAGKLVESIEVSKNPVKVAPHIQATEQDVDRFVCTVNELLGDYALSSSVMERLFLTARACRDASLQLIGVARSIGTEGQCYHEQLVANSSLVKETHADLLAIFDQQRRWEEYMSSSGTAKDVGDDVEFYSERPDSEGTVIYTEKIVEGAFQEINAGTLNKLVERLTHDRLADLTFMKRFITTYQSFCTPNTLLSKLIERYNMPIPRLPKSVPVDEWKKKNMLPVQMRVCSALKFWLETGFPDDGNLSKRLLDFIETVETDGLKLLGQQLRNALAIKTGEQRVYRNLVMFRPHQSKLPEAGLLSSLLLQTFSVEDIAKQMTLTDFSVFAQIQPVELLNQAWTKNHLKFRAPTVLAVCDRFNRIASWVASSILFEESFKERKKKYQKFIELNQEFRKLKNFHAIAAVSSGLNNASIHRLKFTREAVPKELAKVQSDLEELMNPDGSYKNYREAIHTSNPPCLPFLGVYLRDLVFIEDGNPDTIVSGDKTLINFEKRMFVHNVILEIQQYQQAAYDFPRIEPLATFVGVLTTVDDNKQYELSLSREPREATKDSLTKSDKADAKEKMLGKHTSVAFIATQPEDA